MVIVFSKLFQPDRGFDCEHIAFDCNDRGFEVSQKDSNGMEKEVPTPDTIDIKSREYS